MNWKEFLKPNKRKFMVLLLIIALALILIFFLNLILCQGVEDSGTVSINLMDILSSSVCDTGYIPLVILIRLPLWYLLACIAVFIFDKRKGAK